MVRILKTNYFNYFSIFCIWTQVKNKINVVASWVNAQNDSKRPKLSFWVKIRNLKGQIKQEADWRAIDSHKKRTNEFVLFAFLLFTAKKNKVVHSIFGRIYGTPKLLLVLSDLYMLFLQIQLLRTWITQALTKFRLRR